MKITKSRLKQIIMEELKRLIEGPTEDLAVNKLIGSLEFIIEDVVRVLKEGGRTLDDALRLGLQEIWYTGAKEDYEVEEREEQLNDLLADYSGEQIMAASRWLLENLWEQEVVDYGGDSLAMQAALQEAAPTRRDHLVKTLAAQFALQLGGDETKGIETAKTLGDNLAIDDDTLERMVLPAETAE